MLDKTVEITARFLLDPEYIPGGRGTFVAKNVNIIIAIPEGFELVQKPDDVQLDNNARLFDRKAGIYVVGRALKWHGDFVQGIPFELRATIKAVRTGDFDMEARAEWKPQLGGLGGSPAWVGSQVLYISVLKDRAEVRTTRPFKPLPSWSDPPSKVQ